MKSLKFIILAIILPIVSFTQTTIFSENCGTGATSNPLVSTYTGFQNYGSLSFSGNADVRTTIPSNQIQSPSTYSGASGSNNIFITSTLNTNVTISNISTTNYTNISLSLGHFKTTSASNGSEMSIEVSTDGTNWTSLSYSVPTGSGTAIWRMITPSGTIPSTSNLRIRFKMNTVVTGLQFRIDDIKLTGCLTPNSPTSLNVIYTSPACSTTNISLPTSTYLQSTNTGTSTSISTTVTSTSTFYARTQSNVTGCSSVWSNAYGPFTVDIKSQPTINTSPVDVSCYSGDNVSFVASSSYSYVWQLSTDSGASWNNLTIASPYSILGDTLKITNAQLSMSGNRYRILSSNLPCSSTSSASALLHVNTILPVTLIEFNVSYQDSGNLITWSTASEVNNWKFVIERSTNAKNWKIISEFMGDGNSNIKKTYRWIDKSPENGINYYRLSQFDYDGRSDTFKIIAINRDSKEKDVIYYDLVNMIMGNTSIVSNPNYNTVYLKISNGKTEKIIFIK